MSIRVKFHTYRVPRVGETYIRVITLKLWSSLIKMGHFVGHSFYHPRTKYDGKVVFFKFICLFTRGGEGRDLSIGPVSDTVSEPVFGPVQGVPSGQGQGIPSDRTEVTPSHPQAPRTGQEYSSGLPRRSFAAGATSLPFTQEDFLV